MEYNRKSVREELAGKTEMSPENEEDLFERLEEIEKNNDLAAPLSGGDWLVIAAFFAIFGILPLIYYGIRLL